MTPGYVALVLHAHLPFIRHPEHPEFLEERWLFEAISECYLPLLASLDRLEAEQIPFRLTLSLSPTLMAMLDDPLLRTRYQRHLEAALELAEREVPYTQEHPEHGAAHFYHHLIRKLHRLYTVRYARDLLGAFHRLARAGYLELITCGATHGFLPFLQPQPEAVRAQIHIGAQAFQHRFSHAPRGFWLPECGYFPGVEQYLQEVGVQYCFLETHALSHGRPAPPRWTFSHGWTPQGLAIFGRDVLSSRQVWSAQEGYPGDSAYRDFYRDIGFERHPTHLGPLAGPNGVRVFSGFKYYRVTGRGDQKEPYDRWAAEQTAIRHAAHFVYERGRQLAELAQLLPGSPPPLIVCPYDAELFGHWWFEGPFFLEHVARQAHAQGIRFVTAAEYLDRYPAGQGTIQPGYSTWGDQGYADYWCDGPNHWMYRHLHLAGRNMVNLARQHREASSQVKRALNQAARELLLAQASDWAFILRTGTAADYARQRFHTHLNRFAHIGACLEKGAPPDVTWLTHVEGADNLFPDLDYSVYSPT